MPFGYGLFRTIKSTDPAGAPGTPQPDPFGDYTVFVGNATEAPNQLVQAQGFSDADLEKINIGLNNQNVVNDHVMNKFYWGPAVTRDDQVVSVVAVIRPKNGDPNARIKLQDEETLNVIQPTGSLKLNRPIGNAGVSARQPDGFQWIQFDKDTAHPLPEAMPDLIKLEKVGIDYTTSVTVPAPFGGKFGVTQVVDTDVKRTFKGLLGMRTTQAHPRLTDTNGFITRPAPILDTLFYIGVQANGVETVKPPVGQTLRAVDVPGEALDPSPGVGNRAVSEERHDHYITTLMYNPGTSTVLDTIWIPVEDMKWGWDTVATFAAGVWTADPVGTDQEVPVITSGDAILFPVWAHTVSEFTDATGQNVWVKLR